MSETLKGYVRACMDRRFIVPTMKAFEEATGLKPGDYWVESYPGGSALPTSPTGETYASQHGATIFGWGAHGDNCGGQPGVSNDEIQQRLDEVIAEKIELYSECAHYRLFATESGVDVRRIK